MALFDGTETFFKYETGKAMHLPLSDFNKNEIKNPTRVNALVSAFKRIPQNFLSVPLVWSENAENINTVFDDDTDIVEAARLAGMDFLLGTFLDKDMIEHVKVERGQSPRVEQESADNPLPQKKTTTKTRTPKATAQKPKATAPTRKAAAPKARSPQPAIEMGRVGSGKKQKRCRKATVFPCKGECVLRNHPKTGTPQRCRTDLYGAPKTAVEWLSIQTAKLDAMNKKRSGAGLGELKMDDAGYIVNQNVVGAGKNAGRFKKQSPEAIAYRGRR